MNPGKLTPEKLSVCQPYRTARGNWLQLPFISKFEIQLNNVGGTSFLSVPGQEQNAPPKYDFLIHAMSALVDLPNTYLRVQWPDGHYLSNVPVDIWSMMQTGRNGRLFSRPKFIEKNSVIRQEFGTAQTGSVVNVRVYYEGCLLIPA